MESNVSVKGIESSSKALRTEINNLTYTYTNLIDEINLLKHTINSLIECNGAYATKMTFGAPSAFDIINSQKEVWNVNVSFYERCIDYLNSSLHLKTMEAIERFNLEPSELNDISEQISKSVKSIEDILSDNIDII